MFENNLKQFKSRGCICDIENKILQQKIIFDIPTEIGPPILHLASLEPLQTDLFLNPISFCKYLGPLLSHRNGFVCEMCMWISVFRRKKLFENRILGSRDIKQNAYWNTMCAFSDVWGSKAETVFMEN